MDLDNIQQNMNTRVVFKEPRGMVRWIQLFFAILAFSTVVNFYTTLGIDITCPQATPTPPPPPGQVTPPPVAVPVQHPKLIISYPFDFSQQKVNNTCPSHNYTYSQVPSLSGSPQFFVMTGVLSLLYASGSLVVYLLFSSTYESMPVVPIADLIITGILCLFWFVASSSFSSGVSLLKSTVVYENLKQAICPNPFEVLPGAACSPSAVDVASWKSLNVGLVSGFTSFFLWGAGMWFVFKETHFHAPRHSNQFGP